MFGCVCTFFSMGCVICTIITVTATDRKVMVQWAFFKRCQENAQPCLRYQCMVCKRGSGRDPKPRTKINLWILSCLDSEPVKSCIESSNQHQKSVTCVLISRVSVLFLRKGTRGRSYSHLFRTCSGRHDTSEINSSSWTTAQNQKAFRSDSALSYRSDRVVSSRQEPGLPHPVCGTGEKSGSQHRKQKQVWGHQNPVMWCCNHFFRTVDSDKDSNKTNPQKFEILR